MMRFIPTPVGNGNIGVDDLVRPTVHPHACGERLLVTTPACYCPGSSPRLWGTGSSTLRSRHADRFIPTPVGNGIWMKMVITKMTVHPHACGERQRQLWPVGLMRGSSPRLWGTVARRSASGLIVRFIPTPVGNGLCRDCIRRQ